MWRVDVARAGPQPHEQENMISERLWNQAYNNLRSKDPELVEEYEKILSHELNCKEIEPGSAAPEEVKNKIEGDDLETRRSQIIDIIQSTP
jgi:NWD NACHT NTPase-like protein